MGKLKNIFNKFKGKQADNSKKKEFTTSDQYWKDRYEKGGNSGAGSYSNLAEFKAEVLNDFVEKHGINSVIELGSGDGNQLKYFQFPKYIGFDISQLVIDKCRENYQNDSSKQFLHMDDLKDQMADLTMSLDVIYHLVEDEVFADYLNKLFDHSNKYVIIYSSNEEPKGEFAPHVRPRKFTDWVEKNISNYELLDFIPNKFPFEKNKEQSTSFADFYIYKKK